MEKDQSVFMFREIRVGFAKKANGCKEPGGYPWGEVQETKGCQELRGEARGRTELEPSSWQWVSWPWGGERQCR